MVPNGFGRLHIGRSVCGFLDVYIRLVALPRLSITVSNFRCASRYKGPHVTHANRLDTNINEERNCSVDVTTQENVPHTARHF